MISYPVDEAHPITSSFRTTVRKMFEATATANHAKRYVQGSVRIVLLPMPYWSSAVVRATSCIYCRTALARLATPYIYHVGHSVPKNPVKGRRRHF